MQLGIDAAKKAGGVCEAVVCYSGDVASPNETKYTLKYYLDFVEQLVNEGIHVLGVKDMAGLLKPEAAKLSVHVALYIQPAQTNRFKLGSLAQSERNILIFQSMFTHMIPQVLLLLA